MMASIKQKPVVLLPLRLEIRHLKSSGDGNKVHVVKYAYEDKYDSLGNPVSLGARKEKTDKKVFEPKREIWIRWYPDDCQIFPRINKVSASEGESYLAYKEEAEKNKIERKKIGDDLALSDDAREKKLKDLRDRLNIAWNEFVGKVGIQRARFLVDFDGKDPDFDRDDRYVNSHDKPEEGLYQILATGAKLKALPERIKLFTIRENTETLERDIKYLAEGNTIPKDIALSATDIPPARWTGDFEEAIRKGMGIKITDAMKCEQVEKADWLIAVGHKDDREKILEELFLRFKALSELDIFRQDSPTNNFENKTDYIPLESGTEREKIISDPFADQEEIDNFTNGDMLAVSLGLNKKVFAGVKNTSDLEQTTARAMNLLLWDTCTNAYRDYLMNYRLGSNGVYRMREHPETWRYITEYFIDHVLASGPLPSLRIGDNPYGIALTTNLHKWRSNASDPEKQKVEMNIARICRVFRNKYLRLSETSPRIDLAGPADIFDTLVQILQVNAVSKRVDIQLFDNKDQGKPAKGFDKDPQRLTCPLVSIGETPEDKRNEILGYFKLIHSYLGFLKSYLEGNMTDSEFQDALTNLGWQVPTKENQDISLLQRLLQYSAEYLKTSGERTSEFGKAIDLFINLLDKGAISISELEILMIEVLDSLSYQLAPWVIALAHITLDEMRTCSQNVSTVDPRIQELSCDLRKKIAYDGDKKSLFFKGIMTEEEKEKLLKIFSKDDRNIESLYKNSQEKTSHIGVYGWLEKPSAQGIMDKSQGYFQTSTLHQAIASVLLRSAATSQQGNGNKPFQINLSSKRVRKALWLTQALRMGYSVPECLGIQAERFIRDKEMDKYLLDLRKLYPLSDQDENEFIKNSRVIDGEKFLNGTRDREVISETDLASIDEIRSEIRQTRDAVADLYTFELLYHTICGNAPEMNAWLDAIEGKNVPPEIKGIKSLKTGHLQTLRVIYPLIATLDEFNLYLLKNPRSIADPPISGFCQKRLDKFDQVIFRATIRSREIGGGEYLLTISPKDDLRLEPIDLVVGGVGNLERRARIYVWSELLRERDSWRIKKRDLGELDLVRSLIEKGIVFSVKEDTNYVYFNETIRTEVQLIERLGQAGINENDIEKISTIWRDTQHWTFLGREFLSKPTIEEFESKAFISFDYSHQEADEKPMKSFLSKADGIHLFLKSVQPLRPEDMEIPAEIDTGNAFEQTMQGFLLMDKRLKKLKESFETDQSVLKEARNSLDQSAYNDENRASIENKVREIQLKVLDLSKYGLPELLKLIPCVNSEGSRKSIVGLLDSFLEKMEERKKDLDKGAKSIKLKIKGAETVIKIDNDKLVYENNGQEIQEEIKALAIKKFIKEALSLFQKATAGESMPVFPPFVLAEARKIEREDDKQESADYEVYELDETFEDCRKVRKNIDLMKRIIPSGTKEVFSYIVFQKSFEEAMVQGSKKAVLRGISPERLSPDKILKPENWRQSSVEIHFVLPKGGINIAKGDPVIGFNVDEFPIFIPETEQMTALAFQYQTPQAEAPQAILLAIPPFIDPGGTWTDEELAEIIGETIDLMRVRSVPSEAVFGSNLGSMLPALFFDNLPVPNKWICRFPHTLLNLFDGIVKGGFHYVKADYPENYLYKGPSAQRE